MEWWHIVLIVLGVLAVVLAVLFLVGRKMKSKVDDQQALIDQSKITTSILVIDKKKMKVKDSNLPKAVQDQIPKYLRLKKMPLVKAKIGPKIQTLMCDDKVFKELPVKRQVKVEVAGMYIVGIKGVKNIKGSKETKETKGSKKTKKSKK